MRDQTTLGRRVQSHLDAGEYVPDDVTISALSSRLAQDDALAGFILDGFPRTVDQVQALDRMLADSGGRVDRVLHLVVTDEEVLRRLRLRASSDGRSDDADDIIRVRQQIYDAETAPVLLAYRARGLLVEIDAGRDIHQVETRIDAALLQTS